MSIYGRLGKYVETFHTERYAPIYGVVSNSKIASFINTELIGANFLDNKLALANKNGDSICDEQLKVANAKLGLLQSKIDTLARAKETINSLVERVGNIKLVIDRLSGEKSDNKESKEKDNDSKG